MPRAAAGRAAEAVGARDAKDALPPAPPVAAGAAIARAPDLPRWRHLPPCRHAPPLSAYNVTPRPRRPFPQGQSRCLDLDRSFENVPRKLRLSVLINKEKSCLLGVGMRGHSRLKLGDCIHPWRGRTRISLRSSGLQAGYGLGASCPVWCVLRHRTELTVPPS